jgi:hypothetical protein
MALIMAFSAAVLGLITRSQVTPTSGQVPPAAESPDPPRRS